MRAARPSDYISYGVHDWLCSELSTLAQGTTHNGTRTEAKNRPIESIFQESTLSLTVTQVRGIGQKDAVCDKKIYTSKYSKHEESGAFPWPTSNALSNPTQIDLQQSAKELKQKLCKSFERRAKKSTLTFAIPDM